MLVSRGERHGLAGRIEARRSGHGGKGQIGAGHACTTEVGICQIGTGQVGTGQVGTVQVGIPQQGTRQVGTFKMSTRQVGTGQDGPGEVGTRQVPSGKIKTMEVCALKPCVPEIVREHSAGPGPEIEPGSVKRHTWRRCPGRRHNHRSCRGMWSPSVHPRQERQGLTRICADGRTDDGASKSCCVKVGSRPAVAGHLAAR